MVCNLNQGPKPSFGRDNWLKTWMDAGKPMGESLPGKPQAVTTWNSEGISWRPEVLLTQWGRECSRSQCTGCGAQN